MRTIFYTLNLGLFLILSLNSFATEELKEAINNNSVSYTLASNGSGLTEGMLTLKLQNNTKKKISIKIPAGQVYICSDDPRQNLIQVQELLVEIAGSQQYDQNLLSMCIEREDNSPGNGIVYNVGNKADGNLLACADYVSQNEMFNYAGQSAMWVFSNNSSVSNIHGEDPKTKALRSFAAELSGQKETWYTVNYEGTGQLSNSFTNKERSENYKNRVNSKLNNKKSANSKKEREAYQNRVNQKIGSTQQSNADQKSFERNMARVEGRFDYEIKDLSKTKFGIYNEAGELVDLFFENKSTVPGIHSFHFYLAASDIPPGKYYARMYANGELLVERTVEF